MTSFSSSTSSFLRSDIRSVIQYSTLSPDEKSSLLRHISYLTPSEVEELRSVISSVPA